MSIVKATPSKLAKYGAPLKGLLETLKTLEKSCKKAKVPFTDKAELNQLKEGCLVLTTVNPEAYQLKYVGIHGRTEAFFAFYFAVESLHPAIYDFKNVRLFINATNYGYRVENVIFNINLAIPQEHGGRNSVFHGSCMTGATSECENMDDFLDLLCQRVDLPAEYNETYTLTIEGLRKVTELRLKHPSTVLGTRTINRNRHGGLLVAKK